VPLSPQKLGAIAGIVVAAGFVLWQRLRPTPCTGGVFLELRPPLSEAGPYQVKFLLEGGPAVCEFELALPVRGSVDKTRCRFPLKIETRVQEGVTSLVGLALGASPDELSFQLKRGADVIYDTVLEPRYSPYEIRREDERSFCGDRAFLRPACRRGSPECLPFPANCDGPEVRRDRLSRRRGVSERHELRRRRDRPRLLAGAARLPGPKGAALAAARRRRTLEAPGHG
jgi:hypothetical protein